VNTFLFISITLIVLIAAINDARTGYIPDRVSLGGFFLIGIISLLTGNLETACVGACAATAPMLLLYLITRGRGLGLGDVKLSLPIGAALGPVLGLYALGFAFVSGALVAIVLLACARIQRNHEMYFAPYLAAGTVVIALAHIERFA